MIKNEQNRKFDICTILLHGGEEQHKSLILVKNTEKFKKLLETSTKKEKTEKFVICIDLLHRGEE